MAFFPIFIKPLRSALLPLLSIAGVLSFCGNAQAADKSELSIALNAEFATINPIVNTMMTSVMIQDATLRPLMMMTPQGKPQAVLIKEIPTFENKLLSLFKDSQGQHLRAKIEFLKNASWGDGTPVTCADLVTAWKIGVDDKVATPNRQDYLNIQNIDFESKNPKSCIITFNKPQYNFYVTLPRPLPTHLEWPVFLKYNKNPEDYERNSLYMTQISHPGLYNGPFRVSEFKFGSHIILVPNEHFYGTKPFFNKLVFRFILNSSTIEANLLSGTVQMSSSSGMSFDQALAFEKRVRLKNLPYEVQFVPGSMYSHIELNLDHSALSNKQVRQALAYGFNRKEMSQSFFEGRQAPAFHFSTPIDEWYTESAQDIVLYPYDKKKAAELLEQAGWKMGDQGLRWKAGQKLTFTINTVVDNKLNEMLAVYLQNQWKKLGIEIHIKNFPARVFFGDILRRRNFEMALLTWVNPPNFVDVNSLSSQLIPSEKNGWSGHNRAGWKNREVDTLLEKTEQEFDQKKRITYMRKVLKIYSEELPSLPAYYRSNNCVIPKGLQGYEMSGHNFTEFLNVEKWHF